MGKRVGTFRSTYAVALASVGSFLIGYDTGVVGGVLTLPSFQRDFGYAAEQKTRVESNCLSLLQAGAFFGCLLVWPITSRFGRRWAIVAAAMVFCLGATLQVTTYSLACFYSGRVVAGLGTGASSVIVPIYTAEVAPKHIRGKLGGCFQLFITLGVALSYWTDYAVTAGIRPSSLGPPPSKQWQIPIGLQLVPGAILGLGMLFVKESPRWLAQRGHREAAYAALLWIRGVTSMDEDCQLEFQQILHGMDVEFRASGGSTWKELCLPSNRWRVFLAFSLQAAQQCTGNTSLAYYAPQIFVTIGAGNQSIFVTGVYGMFKIAGVVIFITFLVERIGRRTPFMAGAFAMGSFMLGIGILVAMHPPMNADEIDTYGAAAIGMVYLEAFSFNWSWGPLVWLYIGEIFPLKIREVGNVVGGSSQWLFNFAFSQLTPHAIATIGGKTFLLYAFLSFAIVVYAFFVVRETRGKSLEEMETVFGTVGVLEGQASRLQADDSVRLISDYD
ncbi:MFS quinate transporter [Lindgomyces ingoldianus]|uniref:MFS quinate transporter n=1 Tax=Lindgomyces ingoldianus TaxID=673940 RepID=A0ACB6RDJ7_9PLEO|nr:MFS quinate transporter [Lindgomyces ingoldianus]KAF2476800.1 MFS quinate transporter [Lindgomyces ingoldianus]